MHARATVSAALRASAAAPPAASAAPTAGTRSPQRGRVPRTVAVLALALCAVAGVVAIVTHARLPRVPAHQASGVGGASEDGGHSSGSGRIPAPVGGAEDEGSCPISAGAGDSGSDGEWCENFQGSPTVVVDDRGVACHVSALHDSGCCPTPAAGGKDGKRHQRFAADDRCRFFDVTSWDPPAGGRSSNGTNATLSMPHEYADVAEALEFHDGAFCSAQRQCCSLHELCVTCCMAGGDAFPERPPASSRFRPCVATCRHTAKSTFQQNRYATPLHHCYDGPTKANRAGQPPTKK
mmetsp:Transcript_34089/g.105315  ORF Transcript_34089/g.105315 Transcript_34089/m.105315 type:complete len:294 (-) Transcript_34089:15-896(-)